MRRSSFDRPAKWRQRPSSRRERLACVAGRRVDDAGIGYWRGGQFFDELGARIVTAAVGGFFAVDRRSWQKVYPLGMNEGVAYLVQARGTGRDNRTTPWSVESIERYTGISRHRAAAAVKNLLAGGFSRLLRGGTKPKYDLVPFSELPDSEARPTLSAPDPIWLPNELVTGAAGEIPPLELVRQTQDPMTLRLLVEMYHAQNLREDGGVSRRFRRSTTALRLESKRS